MVAIALLSKSDQEYLQKCATQLHFAYGIIIGQKAEPGKYVIVHLAKNGDEDVDLPMPTDDSGLGHGPHKVEQIDMQALTNQMISAFKMIPGSFDVLGIFVTSVNAEIISEHSAEFKSAKRLLFDVHNLLKQGSASITLKEEPNTEYLYLAYSSSTKTAVCKMYNYVSNGGTFSSMDYRFVEKPFEWFTFECNYEMDDVFPVVASAEKINIEMQFHNTIEWVRDYLQASEIFIQNETVEDSQLLETYVKRKRANAKSTACTDDCFKASIFLPIKCLISKCVNPIQVREFNGTIHFQGTITSRIWCNPKNTLADVKRFLREDIMRSLTARIQVYCDGLTDPNVSNESIFISEPPRRVYFSISSGNRPIQFSEYIFRGEAPTVAVAQAKQILDLDITVDSIVADWEGLAEDDAFNEETANSLDTSKQKVIKNSERVAASQELTRAMYMLGIAVALLVLVVSVVVQFILK
uniref:Protein odr-4 homolog n=1 Tax=Glossina palpalis gambiensis TaxID=67801 RepID=A0A1B0B5L0_9MUSC